MRGNAVWISLWFGGLVCANIRQGARIHGITARYQNISQPVETNIASSSTTQTADGINSGIDVFTTTTPFTSGVTRTRDVGTESFIDPSSPPNGDPDRPQSTQPDQDSGRDDSPPPTDCIDTVATYTGEVPDTVYVTVDSSYEVTVTASNVSVAAPTVYETPQQACSTTVLPASGTEPLFAPPEASGSQTYTSAIKSMESLSFSMFNPLPSAVSTFPTPLLAKQTSTVIVTKKTPVQIVQTATSSGPPVTFRMPTPKADPITSSEDPDSTPRNTGQPGGGGTVSPSKDDSSPHPNDPTGNGGSGSPGNPLLVAESTASGLASLINSVINSPFAPATPTPTFIAVPATPTLAGVPVTIGPSTIVIGTQVVPFPESSQNTIVIGSQTFTVNPSQIIGPGTTYSIQNQLAATETITQAPSVVTTAGVTLTVGATLAIISGTTYRIGLGATPTTVTVDGQTIMIGSDGVVFSQTTYAPAITIAGDYEIVTIGSLTMAIDLTEAIISGTTFRIGAGATTTVVTFGSQTVTIGPNGVEVGSTTIHPTSVPTKMSSSNLRSSSAATARATSVENTNNNSAAHVGRSYALWISMCVLASLPALHMLA